MATLAKDTFTRTVAAGGWGTADTGQAWTATNSPSTFSVDGAEGVIAQTASLKTCLATLGVTPAQDVDIAFEWETDALPSGGVWGIRAYPRYVNGTTDYHARLTVTDGGASVTLGLYVSDSTVLVAPVTLPLTYVAGALYHVQVQALGVSPTTIKARAWKDGDAIPGWQVTATDSTTALQAAAVPGLRVGGSSAPLVAHFDNLVITDGTAVDPAVGHVAYMAVTQPDSTSLPVGVAFTDATATADVVLSRAGVEIDRKTATVTANGFAHALFTGLPAGTQHTVTVEIGGVEQTDRSLTVITQPDAGSFTFVAGSCQFTGSNHPVFDRMLAATPAFISHAGDLQYDNATDVPTWLAGERASMSAARFRGLLERTPIARTWDNHDRIIADKGGGGLPLNMGTTDPQTNTLWREFAGAFPVTGVVGQTWTTGRVRFIQTDGWTVRDDPDADPEPRTFLGAAQKQWFKDTLTAATEPVIVWFCQWTAQENANGRWASFPSETAELEAWMDAHPDVKARMVMIGGDSHSLQADDGSRTRSDTVFNGIPSLNISGFNRSGDTVDETVWSIANLPLRTSAQPEADWGGFSRVTVTDNGPTIGFAWEGVRVDSTGVEDVMASWSKDFPATPTPPPAASPLSIRDLEYLWLQGETGLSPQQGSYQDLKRIFMPNGAKAYWANLSGLTPISVYSLSDHMTAALRSSLGVQDGSLADLYRQYLIREIG